MIPLLIGQYKHHCSYYNSDLYHGFSDRDYHLQYMSGATITSDGLNHFLKRDLDRYKTILKGISR